MSIHDWLNDWSAWGWPLLARHLWQATLFSGVVFILAAFLKRAPARARYGLWLIAAAKFIVPSVLFVYLARRLGLDLSALSNFFHVSVPGAPVISQVAEPVIQFTERTMMSSGKSVEVVNGHQEIYYLLTITWLAGCALLLGRWWMRHRRIVRSIRAGTFVTNERVRNVMERVRGRLGIRRNVKLIASAGIGDLGVWGVWKPVLLLPKNISEGLSDEELETVMTHELIHVKRWDNLVGNFQMLLCCALWFHPVVWILDRKLLTERERACDDEVLRLGSPSNVYASSLLKVSRFGLGLKTVGVSGASGSHLSGRIKRIMAPNVTRKLTAVHRLLVSASAIMLIFFSVGAGLLSGEFASAQGERDAVSQMDRNGATIQQMTAEANLENLDGRAAFIPAGTMSQEQAEGVRDKLGDAAEVPIQTENQDGAPLNVIEARVKVVPLERELSGRGRAEELVSPSSVRLVNQTNQRITFLRLSLRSPNSWHDIVGFAVAIEPRSEYVLHPDLKKWSNTIRPGTARNLSAQIVAVQFEDGSTWGEFDSRALVPTPAPPAPSASYEQPVPPDTTMARSLPTSQGDEGRYYPAQFENPPGAPLIIIEARAKSVLRPDIMPLPAAAQHVSSQPVVTLSNVTSQRIVALKLRFKADTESHFVTAFRTTIEPHSSFVFRDNSIVSGGPERMRVQVIGVQFEDGSVWGAMNSRINSRDEVVAIPLSISKVQPKSNFDVRVTPVAPRARIESTVSGESMPVPPKTSRVRPK